MNLKAIGARTNIANTWLAQQTFGEVTLGDIAGVNYIGVASDGTLTLHGTARQTKHIIISNADLGKGASGAAQVIVGNYTVWEFRINDDAVMQWELPADWAVGTDVDISVHWQINEAYATANAEVRWEVAWSATPHDETEPLDGPTHSGALDPGDQNIPAIARYLTTTEIGTIAGASLSAGDSLGIRLKRIALGGGANPTPEAGVIHLEFHYTCGSLGE